MKSNLEIDRRLFFGSLGGVGAVTAMDHEARAESLEEYMSEQLEQSQAPAAPEHFPTVAELEAQNADRARRRGLGAVFGGRAGHTPKLAKMPEKPTLQDFFKYRFSTVNHVLQS